MPHFIYEKLTEQQLLDTIRHKMIEHRNNKKMRIFFNAMRLTLNVDWAGSLEIYNKFRTRYDVWITRKGTNNLYDQNFIKLAGKDKVINFSKALYGDLILEKQPSESKSTGKAVGKLSKDDIFEIVEGWLNKNGGKTLQEAIQEEAAKLQPNYIKINKSEAVKMEGTLHKAFKLVLELSVQEKQVFIAGPAGTGKTTLASQVAQALKLRYSSISCTAGMSEAHLLGRMDALGNYISTDFVDLYENGGVFLFDEVDAADSNTMLIINSALANGHLSIPNRKESRMANRHKDFYCICAANTWGYGSSEYAGRNVLDAAFLDRFAGSRVLVDYDTDLERKIGGKHQNLVKAVWEIRKNVTTNKIRRVVSTRAIISGVRSLDAGNSLKSYISDRFLTGWSQEEKAKALTNVLI